MPVQPEVPLHTTKNTAGGAIQSTPIKVGNTANSHKLCDRECLSVVVGGEGLTWHKHINVVVQSHLRAGIVQGPRGGSGGAGGRHRGWHTASAVLTRLGGARVGAIVFGV